MPGPDKGNIAGWGISYGLSFFSTSVMNAVIYDSLSDALGALFGDEAALLNDLLKGLIYSAINIGSFVAFAAIYRVCCHLLNLAGTVMNISPFPAKNLCVSNSQQNQGWDLSGKAAWIIAGALGSVVVALLDGYWSDAHVEKIHNDILEYMGEDFHYLADTVTGFIEAAINVAPFVGTTLIVRLLESLANFFITKRCPDSWPCPHTWPDNSNDDGEALGLLEEQQPPSRSNSFGSNV